LQVIDASYAALYKISVKLEYYKMLESRLHEKRRSE